MLVKATETVVSLPMESRRWSPTGKPALAPIRGGLAAEPGDHRVNTSHLRSAWSTQAATSFGRSGRAFAARFDPEAPDNRRSGTDRLGCPHARALPSPQLAVSYNALAYVPGGDGAGFAWVSRQCQTEFSDRAACLRNVLPLRLWSASRDSSGRYQRLHPAL